ncbi:MAG TPA: hypothetical protein VGO11_21130 [Chthoniobacteraceae bacterium]|jgi:hypothetical protein|nr:hypothetical protein [Chthoniobacteraceae bacterium]
MKFDAASSRRGGLAALALFLLVASGNASPLENLKSPSQELRDEAAAELRPTYHATPESRWTPLLESIRKGQTEEEVLALLRPHNVLRGKSLGRGEAYTKEYRLDYEWSLFCDYRTQGDKDLVVDRRLDRELRGIWVEPPPDFTGLWIVYFPNGQKSFEIHYKDGLFDGEFITCHGDGSKWIVQHYVRKIAQGPETGYHASGKILYTGQHWNNKPVGTWRYFDEAGNLTVTEEKGSPVAP